MSDAGYADRILAEALRVASHGLDLDRAATGAAAALEAVAAQAEALRGKDFNRMKAPDLARTLAQSMKALDELTRLVTFAKGQPDSRRDQGDWLRLLSDDQLEQIEQWVREAERKKT